MIGCVQECSSPGRRTPGRLPPFWCGRTAALSVRKQKKAQLTNKEGNIGDSIFSKWLIRMGRKAELTVGGKVGGWWGCDFSCRLIRGVGKIEAQRCDEMRGGAVSGGVWPGRTHPAVRCGLYICCSLCWNDGFIFMACLSVRDILQADTIRARCCGRGAGEVERHSSWHTACVCLSCVCDSLNGINTQTTLVDSGLVQKCCCFFLLLLGFGL